MAEYLKEGRPSVHIKGYASAQTGNFDLYLPFVERGISLLNETGRLGFIAPSLWTVNEYGEGLRRIVEQGKNLESWIDFKSFQVFDEATNYTALQFFTKSPNEAIRIASAPTGVIPERSWDQPGSSLKYGKQIFGDRWLLLTGKERDLIDRLYMNCTRLDDTSQTKNIFVGLQTSADAVYHLRRLGPRHYICSPRGDDAAPPYEVEIEDEIMKPLISGQQAKRYINPISDTYLLFPYRISDDKVELISTPAMAKQFPKAWAYLRSYESVLRSRELKKNRKGEIIGAPFDNEQWYRFGRHQNLDKQEIPKLVVPRLVAHLACSVDEEGVVYLDNVDVGGVEVANEVDPFFLAGILNSPVTDFVFRRISKPFRGDYLSANKQFIAPLPVPPRATAAQRADVAKKAALLQKLHTKRGDLLDSIRKRLSTSRSRSRPETWLFPTVKSKKAFFEQAPSGLSDDDRESWAQQRFELGLSLRYDSITNRLHTAAELDAQFSNGELAFTVDGVPVIDRIFVEEDEGAFITAQWKVIASTFSITENTNGKKLCSALRKLALPENSAVVAQIIQLERELSGLEADIHQQERGINELIYNLYQLGSEDITMIENGVA